MAALEGLEVSGGAAAPVLGEPMMAAPEGTVELEVAEDAAGTEEVGAEDRVSASTLRAKCPRWVQGTAIP